ncbi:hypothetical protein [Salinicola avicenniae]|uniref:hypothetical protein n=1 Tax=Salinicola avicenniae TaxID=2916836 RepID=UPI002072AF1B|nr:MULTISPECIES: hypothetical protein [unclassified Salinicola]
MMEYVGFFHSIVAIMMILLLAAVAGGIGIKVYSVMLAILAFPTYLGLYILEVILPRKRNGESVFSLSIPKKNPHKVIMNFSATCVTLGLLSSIWPFFSSEFTPESQEKWVESMFNGRLLDPIVCFSFLTGLFAIFVISRFFSDKDDRDTLTKIESLSIPSLWKVVVKDIGNS